MPSTHLINILFIRNILHITHYTLLYFCRLAFDIYEADYVRLLQRASGDRFTDEAVSSIETEADFPF